jgi:hypothetical protein
MIEFLVTVLIGAVVVAAERVRRDSQRQHRERLAALLLTTLAPAAARGEPSDLLAWRATAGAVRKMFPEAVGDIERQTGEAFPFSHDVIDDAHARWTAEWLAWERRHDVEFKQRASALEAQLRDAGVSTPEGRARLAALDDEKLQAYQQRYEEYVRVGNGLTALKEPKDVRV